MDEMEVKNQQIQTEIVKTVKQHVQAGSTAQQQGVHTHSVDAAYQCGDYLSGASTCTIVFVKLLIPSTHGIATT